MNQYFKPIVFGLGLLLIGFGTSRALAFEGVVDFHMVVGDHQMDYECLIKEHKSRVNQIPNTQKSAIIADSESHGTTILMIEQKMYMVPKDMADQARALKTPENTQKEADEKKAASEIQESFSDTGNSEVILGHKCEEYLSTAKDKDISVENHIWLAAKMGSFGGLLQSKSKEKAAWVKMVQDKGLFVLKVVSVVDGKIKSTMTATKIEKKEVDDSNFEVPADYKEFKMSDIINPLNNLNDNLKNQMRNKGIPGF